MHKNYSLHRINYNQLMDNSNDPPIGTLTLSKKQKQLIKDLEVFFRLLLPKALVKNPKWAIKFLKLFTFDTSLPADHSDQKGIRIVRTIRNDYFNGNRPEETARKLNIEKSDVLFVVDVLDNYCTIPLKQEVL